MRYWFLPPLLLAIFPRLFAKKNGILVPQFWKWMGRVGLFHLYLMVTALWAPDRIETFEIVLELGMILALLIIGRTLFFPSLDKGVEVFFRIFFWTSLLYALAGISGYWFEGYRMAAFGGGSNVFARIMGSGLIASVYLSVKTQRKIWLFLNPLFLACGVFSGSRGGIIAILVSYTACCLLLYTDWNRRWLASAFAVGSVILAVAVFYLSEPARAFWDNRFVEQTYYERYTANRDIIYLEAWELFLENPIFGVGLNGFQQFTVTPELHPHNLLLSIASETGAIGLGLFLAAMFPLLKRWTQPRTLEHNACLCAGILYFVAGMFSGYYYDARFMWLFLLFYMFPCRARGGYGRS